MDYNMKVWRAIFALGAVIMVASCSHPLVISGDGDILSASGTRNCYLEDFQAGSESCTVNLVVGDYLETYYAVPREGWQFEAWENYCTDGSTADQCSFDYDASLVRKFWGQTVLPLVAVFTQDIPPSPTAMYSYAIDERGLLIDPLPLEGAQLQRKAAYFTITGDYQRVNFWCCKVPDGEEAHGDKVEDLAEPFVLRVDLGALPADGGLPRELYADLFTSATDYSGHAAYWTLEPPNLDGVTFSDGGTHTIDYTIPGSVTISGSTTVNVLDGAELVSGIGIISAESTLNIYGGEVHGENYGYGEAEINIYGGHISTGIQNYDAHLNIYDGSVNSINAFMAPGWINIHGGTVGGIFAGPQTIKITGGTIGGMFVESNGRLEISGGTFVGGILIDNLLLCDITGGDFQAGFETKEYGSCHIKGGRFSGPFIYRDDMYRDYIQFTFYGDLELTPIDQWDTRITGTLADGSALSQTITCDNWQWWPDYDGPYCDSVVIVND
jgi:hypothetical protein